jgi:phage shock protein A
MLMESLLTLSTIGNAIAITVVLNEWKRRNELAQRLIDRETELREALKKFADLYSNSEMQIKKVHDTVADMQTKISAISAQFSAPGAFRR